jgi:hypothetical protein
MTRSSLQSRSTGIATFGVLASLGIGSIASAGPLAGEVLKFQQLPLGDLATNPASQFPGHDELSTASLSTASGGYSGTFAADDFSDNVTSPIVDVQWWGSYLPNSPSNAAQQFLISFETDVPATSTSGFSQPGLSLSSEVVTLNSTPPLTPTSGTFSQTVVPSVGGGPDGPLYEYNAELANPFPEQAGKIYWLKIVALDTPGSVPVQWGWHNRDYTIPDPYAAPPGDSVLGTNDIGQPVYHYLDDAVTGNVNYLPGAPPPQNLFETNMSPLSYSNIPSVDGFGATGIAAPSEDLAFSLYYNPTVPEPVATPILGLGWFLLRRNRRRSNSAQAEAIRAGSAQPVSS